MPRSHRFGCSRPRRRRPRSSHTLTLHRDRCVPDGHAGTLGRRSRPSCGDGSPPRSAQRSCSRHDQWLRGGGNHQREGQASAPRQRHVARSHTPSPPARLTPRRSPAVSRGELAIERCQPPPERRDRAARSATPGGGTRAQSFVTLRGWRRRARKRSLGPDPRGHASPAGRNGQAGRTAGRTPPPLLEAGSAFHDARR
jgi:hypothetical protein